jgi:hypothetical protein
MVGEQESVAMAKHAPHAIDCYVSPREPRIVGRRNKRQLRDMSAHVSIELELVHASYRRA